MGWIPYSAFGNTMSDFDEIRKSFKNMELNLFLRRIYGEALD